MMRLPPTGISISQGDLAQTLQQLEIYEGLLKQGFKKGEIATYFREQRGDGQSSRRVSLLPEPGPAPSTISIYRKASEKLASLSMSPKVRKISTSDSSNADIVGRHDTSEDESESSSSSGNITLIHTKTNDSIHLDDCDKNSRPYVPRQSSLLRFARAVSSESLPSQSTQTRVPLSRPNISYRPRSETYSYDQSVMDDDKSQEDTVDLLLPIHEKLEYLTVNDELVFDSNLTPAVVSDLRPEAVAFIPSRALSIQSVGLETQLDKCSDGEDQELSFPSSPPEVSRDMPDSTIPLVPRSPETPVTQSGRLTQQRQQLGPQYLDGSFTVYDDSLPAIVQPQTPADLDRRQRVNAQNAAYTAPPGMIRSAFSQSASRQLSGDQSPTARAILIRQRRQREFIRSARIEGLRLDRARDRARIGLTPSTILPNDLHASEEAENNFWRDDLDADAVGDENFDAEMLAESNIRMRVVSGNRRFAQDI